MSSENITTLNSSAIPFLCRGTANNVNNYTSVNNSDDENNVEEEMETILGQIQTQIEKKKFGKKQKKKVLKLLDKLSAIADNCGGK